MKSAFEPAAQSRPALVATLLATFVVVCAAALLVLAPALAREPAPQAATASALFADQGATPGYGRVELP